MIKSAQYSYFNLSSFILDNNFAKNPQKFPGTFHWKIRWKRRQKLEIFSRISRERFSFEKFLWWTQDSGSGLVAAGDVSWEFIRTKSREFLVSNSREFLVTPCKEILVNNSEEFLVTNSSKFLIINSGE